MFDIYLIFKENLNGNLNFLQFLNYDLNVLIDGEAISNLTKNEEMYSDFCVKLSVATKKIIENISFCETFFEGEIKTNSKLNIFLRKLKKITLLPIIILIDTLNGNTSLKARKQYISECMKISLQVSEKFIKYSNVVFKELIVYLIENISSTSNMSMIIDILEQNSSCLKNFNVLRDLITLKETLDILNSHNIKSNLLDLLKVDLLIKRQGLNFFKSSFFELFSSCLTKMIRERKTDIYTKLLDQNLGIVNVFGVIF